MINLETYLSLPQSCVFGVFNESRNTCFVHYTQNMGDSMAYLYEGLRGKPGYHLRVLSATTDLPHLKLYCQYYRDYYRRLGWEYEQSVGRVSIKYRVRAMVASDMKSILVELVTARGDVAAVVGKFKTAVEAQDFIATYYADDNIYCFPVYAANSDTKEFLQNSQTKMLDIWLE